MQESALLGETYASRGVGFVRRDVCIALAAPSATSESVTLDPELLKILTLRKPINEINTIISTVNYGISAIKQTNKGNRYDNIDYSGFAHSSKFPWQSDFQEQPFQTQRCSNG